MTLGGLLINRRTHRRYRLDGCRRSHVKPLLSLALPFLNLLTRQQLPDVVDFRSSLSPIEEQYTLGSCVGNALASIIEYFYFITTGHRKLFSGLFIYYNARMMEDEVSERNATETDSGADLQFAIVSLLKYGCCEQQLWPFDKHLINQQPSEEAYDNGQNYRLKEFGRLSNNVNQLRECLAQGYPFVMAIRIFSSFASNHHGYIPMPKRYEKSSQYRHAVVCVGYIHSEKVFIIRNSHGTEWGDHGYGYLPYAYITDKLLTKDLWAIKSIKNLTQIPIERNTTWNDSPILSKSASQHDMTDDPSMWDIVYTGEDDEEEDPETISRHEHYHRAHSQEYQETLNPHKQYHRDHSQEYQREYAGTPVQQQQQQEEHPMQPPFMNPFPSFHVPSPMLYTTAPLMRSYSYHPTIYGSVPFFRPY